MTTLAEPVAGPSSGSSAITASIDATNDLPKRKRARTRKRKSGVAAGAKDQDDEDEEGQEASFMGSHTNAANENASSAAADSKGKGKALVSTPAEQPLETIKAAANAAIPAPVIAKEAANKANDAGSDDDDEDGEGNATGRKRKRSRKRSKKSGQGDSATAAGNDDEGAQTAQNAGAAAAPSVAATLPGAELVKQLAQTPNPEQDESISQGAKNGELSHLICCRPPNSLLTFPFSGLLFSPHLCVRLLYLSWSLEVPKGKGRVAPASSPRSPEPSCN